MRVLERVDRYQRYRRWAGLPLAVLYKFYDDQALYLAALLAYCAFLSLFPLLLILVAVLVDEIEDLAPNSAGQLRGTGTWKSPQVSGACPAR